MSADDMKDDLGDARVSIAADVVRAKLSGAQRVGERTDPERLTAIVLGSGLGSLAEKIESPFAIPFTQIPGFARSTAGGHRGELISGWLGDAPVIAMAGRLHRYEGWTNRQVDFPIRVMHFLGANRFIASNAAGGVNPKLRVGDILVIRDHINWLHQRVHHQRVDHQRVDHQRVRVGDHGSSAAGNSSGAAAAMGVLQRGQVYDARLAKIALAAARDGGFTAMEGTYLATLGPTYETRAEYRMMRRLGADVVGMSTVGEAQTAANLGMRVLALSIVSNVADPDRANVADHAEVLEAGDAAAAKLEGIVRRVIGGQ